MSYFSDTLEKHYDKILHKGQHKRIKMLHCAYLLRTIFASSERANERVHLHNEKNFPQAKLNSEINDRFLLNRHRNL